MVESQPSKLLVAGSIPVSRSILRSLAALDELGDGKPPFVDAAVGAVPKARRRADLSAVAATGECSERRRPM